MKKLIDGNNVQLSVQSIQIYTRMRGPQPYQRLLATTSISALACSLVVAFGKMEKKGKTLWYRSPYVPEDMLIPSHTITAPRYKNRDCRTSAHLGQLNLHALTLNPAPLERLAQPLDDGIIIGWLVRMRATSPATAAARSSTSQTG